LQHAIDTGDVLMRKKISIRPDQTAGELHDEMKVLGAQMVYDTLDGYCNGTLQPVPQNQLQHDEVGSNLEAPKLHTETCKIDWHKSAHEVFNLIRGLSPYPGAFTFLNEKMLKIYKASFQEGSVAGHAGKFETDGKTYLKYAANDGWVYVSELQLEGKKRMLVEDFLRGYRF
jgi:methionyl-tRNA formyltransferase